MAGERPASPSEEEALDRETLLRWWRQADQEREQMRISLEISLEHIQQQDALCRDLEEQLCASCREVAGLTAALAGCEAGVGCLKQRFRQQEGGGEASLGTVAKEELRSAIEELQITAEELQESNDLLCRATEELEERVAARTGELARSNADLHRALAERDLLLREVHHRVRNNMQTVLSLLRLQARRRVPEVHPEFGSALDRIHAMAVAQNLLYGVEDLSRIDFAAHLRGVAPLLLRAHGGNVERIRLDLTACPCIVDLDTATPLSLIVSEALSNTVRHAFPNAASGTIRISLEETGTGCPLAIQDDGVGLPAGLEECRRRGLGLTIVQALAGQLGADLRIGCEGRGCSVIVTLRQSKAAS